MTRQGAMTQTRRRAWAARSAAWVTAHAPLLLILLIGLALVVRVGYLIGFGALNDPLSFDELTYNNLASSLASGHGFVNDGHLTAFRAPGYPFFVAALYLVLGPSFVMVRLLQAALAAVTLVFIYAIGKCLFNPRVGLIAAFCAAVYPLLVVMTGELYSEVLVTFLLALTLWLLVLDRQAPRRIYPWLIGFLLGVLTLVRPNLLLLVVLFPLCFFAVYPLRRALVAGLIIAGVALLAIVPWTVRNYATFHEWIPLTTQTGLNFWQGNNPAANGSGSLPNRQTWNGPIPPELGLGGWRGLSEQQSSERFMQVAMQWIRENPVAAMRLLPLKLRQLWSPLALTTVSERRVPPLAETIVPVPYAVFIVLAVVGVIVTRKRWRALLPFYALILAVNISTLIFFGGARYALPMALSLLLFCAAGVDWLWLRLAGGNPSLELWRNSEC